MGCTPAAAMAVPCYAMPSRTGPLLGMLCRAGPGRDELSRLVQGCGAWLYRDRLWRPRLCHARPVPGYLVEGRVVPCLAMLCRAIQCRAMLRRGCV